VDFIKRFDKANNSMYTIIHHFALDLPYHDSLQYHFRYTTALWTPKINQEFFERTTSTDLNIIENDSLKDAIINYYSFAKGTFDIRMERYASIMDHASKNVFNTRFNAFWNNTWKDTDFPDNSERDMKPNDYDVLKSDREYRYFLETLKNQLYWYVRSPLKQANEKADHLVFQIDNELRELKK
jgi:hypothetical protein